MRTAADGDIIVVSGVITENVTLDKDVTLRGPLPDWNTPGTHMGFVQGATAKPTSTCTGGTVITVEAGTIVTIEDLNIRHGCATDGGGIRNEGTLNLVRSTVYDNRASASGGGIYNAGTLTVADSTLSGNASRGRRRHLQRIRRRAADGAAVHVQQGTLRAPAGRASPTLTLIRTPQRSAAPSLRRQAQSPSAPPTSARTRPTL